MAIMTHRCTFALDEATTRRIRRLATLWSVSQAEVIRRVIARADAPADKPDPAALLRQLHESGEGLDASAAHEYLAQVARDRRNWRSP